MREFDPNYVFPSSPPRIIAPMHLNDLNTAKSSDNFGNYNTHKQRPLSFSPQTRRRHQHRRSGAVSEDLGATDLATLLTPLPRTPHSAHNLHISPENSPITNDSVDSNNSKMTNSSSSFEGLYGITGPTLTESMNTSSQSSIQFSDSKVLFKRANLGEPGQIYQTNSSSHTNGSDSSSFSNLSSPASTEVSTANVQNLPYAQSPPSTPRKNKKRRSFVSLFKRTLDDPDATLVPNSYTTLSGSSSSSGISSNLEYNQSPSLCTQPVCNTKSSPAPNMGSNLGINTLTATTPSVRFSPSFSSCFNSPRIESIGGMSSPLLGNSGVSVNSNSNGNSFVLNGFNSHNVYPIRTPVVDSARIDLDEALSCSFEHRPKLNDQLSGSPFSKKSCAIGPVLEEEDEETDMESRSSRSSSHLQLKLNPPKLRHPSPLSASPVQSSVRNDEHIRNLAILEPKVNISPKSSPRRGHSRKRSLLDRIMGR